MSKSNYREDCLDRWRRHSQSGYRVRQLRNEMREIYRDACAAGEMLGLLDDDERAGPIRDRLDEIRRKSREAMRRPCG